MPNGNNSRSRQGRQGVFISYARSDGEKFAGVLQTRLEALGISAWLDRVRIEHGRDWWLQITEALNQVGFMALVITPNALKSETVRREWRYAREQGVCVYPVKATLALDFKSLPGWMRKVHFYDIGTVENNFKGPDWEKFVENLNVRTLEISTRTFPPRPS